MIWALQQQGTWQAKVWAPGVWAYGVWREVPEGGSADLPDGYLADYDPREDEEYKRKRETLRTNLLAAINTVTGEDLPQDAPVEQVLAVAERLPIRKRMKPIERRIVDTSKLLRDLITIYQERAAEDDDMIFMELL
jgi:hypothetical protein